jgi:hypothetical protein
MLKFSELLEGCDNLVDKTGFGYEIRAIERALDQKRSDPFGEILVKAVGLSENEGMDAAMRFLEMNRMEIGAENYCLVKILFHLHNREFAQAASGFRKLKPAYIQSRRVYSFWGFALFKAAEIDKDNKKELLVESLEKFRLASEYEEPEEALYGSWGRATIRLAFISQEITLFDTGIGYLKKAIRLAPEDVGLQEVLAMAYIGATMVSGEPGYAMAAFNSIKVEGAIGENNPGIISLWLMAIMISLKFANENSLPLEQMIDATGQASVAESVDDRKRFLENPGLYYFKKVFPFLKSALMVNMTGGKPVLIEWINIILNRIPKSLQKEDLDFLRSVISAVKAVIPELAVSGVYIDVYEEYFLNGNQNALYELPKEQRVFFEKNILRE